MQRYFRKSLKLFILAKLKYQDLKLENFNQMVKKVVNVEAKAILQPYFSTREKNQNYSYGNQPTNSTIIKS